MINISIVTPIKNEDIVQVTKQNDESILVDHCPSIGQARIKGTLKSSHDWILMTDSDGTYPKDFIDQVRAKIESNVYPIGFWCTRRGGFVSNWLESGLVVRKDIFLERTSDYFPTSERDDIGRFFYDLPIATDIVYTHSITTNERNIVAFIILIISLFIGYKVLKR